MFAVESGRRNRGACAGAGLFARYAFGPNRLGYCGPGSGGAGGEAVGGDERPRLPELARGFDGAWPYLGLSPGRRGIGDPLDRRVVEAYWLGSPLLDGVPRTLAESLATGSGHGSPGGWRWLAATAGGGRPVHAFHVLDVFPRVGLLRLSRRRTGAGGHGRLRIRWGRVLERRRRERSS